MRIKSQIVTAPVAWCVHVQSITQDFNQIFIKTTMWANAERDGRPAEYRWRPLFNAAKFG